MWCGYFMRTYWPKFSLDWSARDISQELPIIFCGKIVGLLSSETIAIIGTYKNTIYHILYIYHRIVHLLWACCVFSLPPSHSNRYWVLHQASKGMFRSSTFHEWPPRMIWTYCIGNGWTQHMLPQLTLKIWKVSLAWSILGLRLRWNILLVPNYSTSKSNGQLPSGNQTWQWRIPPKRILPFSHLGPFIYSL